MFLMVRHAKSPFFWLNAIETPSIGQIPLNLHFSWFSIPEKTSIIIGLILHLFKLVGGLEHFLFSIIYGLSSFPLTFIFFKLVKTTRKSLFFLVKSHEIHIFAG